MARTSGTRRFRDYRLRALLYAGRPNRAFLDTLTPPGIPKSPFDAHTPCRASAVVPPRAGWTERMPHPLRLADPGVKRFTANLQGARCRVVP